ncbi:sialate O-acetylesterase [Pedobacter cryotolerans]|uniref:Sialate O-acetylesterase n=1 Tax=Pedobacter cryotolerans TaxID=2571270 RepID=A0A4U1C9T1_9SPHI|nr:sialate O-acetylesterase [Pedobacter cryotolerans]TKC01536.1 sialate O-acetylesterase [Pedobacter cryotolerans]
MKKASFSFIFSLFIIFSATAEIKLPALVSNGMVLQRDQNIKIWGWANVDEQITVTFKNKKYTTKANSQKEWSVNIEPQKAGGPFKILINTIEINDLLIGDVWLCSGQSNMEAVMNRANIKAHYPQVIASSNYPMIRQFTVKRDMAFNLLADVTSDKGWVAVNPTTILDFSAVAFFFVRDLYEKYKIPIGIINSSVGGTPIQSWVDREAIKNLPAYYQIAQKLKDTAEVSRILKAHQLKTESWYKSIKEDDLGVNEKWFLQTDKDGANWEEIANLSKLDKAIKLPKYGSIWFKTTINIPKELALKPSTLSLGMMHTEDETYVNGQKVGSINSGYTDRNYQLKAGQLKEGKNIITIRLTSPTTGISFNAKNNYQLKFQNDSIALNNAWKYKFGIEKELLPRGNGLSQHSPTAYYYAMIKPMANYAIKGVTWYQGESNTPKPEEYEGLLTSLIKLWRADWQQTNLPFLYLQLANHSPSGTEPAISNWALLREAQQKALKNPNSAMIVTHDIGEKDDIHPRNKLDVGKRLALAARKLAYHERIVYSGPTYKSMQIANNQIIVSFNHVGRGLKFIGEQLNMFTISADGKNFVKAEAKIVGSKVVVWSKSIAKPIAVRYAWANSPDGANLYNMNGLPAASFKSN